MEPSIEIEVVCYCGEKTHLYFPCSDRVAQSQMTWLFEHLSTHKAVYHKVPFNLEISPIAGQRHSDAEENIEQD